MIGTSEYMIMSQALNPLAEYKKIIQFLSNETMDQCIHVMDPEWENTSSDKITAKCYKIAQLMGLINGRIT